MNPLAYRRDRLAGVRDCRLDVHPEALDSVGVRLHLRHDPRAARWDGQGKRYGTSADGTAFFHLFGATTLTAGELKGKVTAWCLP